MGGQERWMRKKEGGGLRGRKMRTRREEKKRKRWKGKVEGGSN